MTILLHIFALALKEFRALFRDKRSRFVLFGPPLIQLLVFGYAATFDLERVPFAVYNEDPGSASRDLIARFEGTPNFRAVAPVSADEQIAPLIDDKHALLVLHLGPDFSQRLAQDRSAPLQVIIDGRNSNTALVALGYVREILTRFNQDWAQRHGYPATPARLDPIAWFNPNLESRWFFVPGIVGLITLVVTMVVTSLSVAREREAGTFDQLLVTPLHPVAILIGKALPGFIIGILEASFIITVAVLWFDVPLRGSLPALYLGITLFMLSSVGVGLMISSLSVTQQQGLLGAFLFLVPAVILSGFATPIENMPEVVQMLTYVNPLRYFLVILRGVFLQGAGFSDLGSQYWPMALIGIIALATAGQLFRHRMY